VGSTLKEPWTDHPTTSGMLVAERKLPLGMLKSDGGGGKVNVLSVMPQFPDKVIAVTTVKGSIDEVEAIMALLSVRTPTVAGIETAAAAWAGKGDGPLSTVRLKLAWPGSKT
jgi:hypothetical protein